MAKRFLILFAAALCVTVSTAQAGTIKSITATTVGTAFSSFTGILTLNGTTGIDVQDIANIVTTTSGGSFSLTTTRTLDTSSGGIASANFAGGNFSYKDASSVIMLSGTIDSFSLVEVFDGSGMFAGKGSFTVALGGTLNTAFGTTGGSMVDISFSVSPNTISDFDTGFTGSSNMTILPASNQTPEPATIMLMGMGIATLIRKRKLAVN